MLMFKGYKISVNQLLGIIPEALLSKLSETTKVDYYAKVLHGKKMFYLLLYGISERLSKIDSDYFKQIYQYIYQQFNDAYPKQG